MISTEWVGITLTATGTAAATAISLAALRTSRRSARAADTSAQHAGTSASAAERSAAHAAQQTRLACLAWHDQNRPTLPAGGFEARLHPSGAGPGRLFYTFTLPRTYRVQAVAHSDDQNQPSWHILGVPDVVRAGQAQTVEIGMVPIGRRPDETRMEFKFWPPTSLAGEPGWDCPCGAEGVSDPLSGLPATGWPYVRGHWTVQVQVPDRFAVEG